jgi:hypothetical protein
MSAAFAQKISVRLFIQAAFTGLLAMSSARGSTWLLVTFAVAAGAAVVGAVIRTNQTNARRLVIGFEGVAVAIGGIGLTGGHYIPGTIVGIATLITVLGTSEGAVAPAAPFAAAVPAPGGPAGPAFAAVPAATPDDVFAAPDDVFAAPAAATPAFAAPAPPPATPVEVAPAPRTMTILPGK